MGKPGTIYTDPNDEAKRGWDPTDPDPANPWDAVFSCTVSQQQRGGLYMVRG